MRYRVLGRTGLLVSELCLGTMTYGGQDGMWGAIGQLGQEEVNAQLRTAFDAGVNFIDTANVYAGGRSETLLGAGLKALGLPRDELVIATKSTGPMDETPNGRGQSRYHIMNAVEASLKRLQIDHIDLYQIHGFDPVVPLEETLGTLDDLVRSGKVRYIGLCNLAAWQIMKALGISAQRGWSRFESVQAYYTLAGRDLEREVLPLVEDQQLGLMVWSPLAGGLLSGKFHADGSGPPGARRATFDFPVVDKPRAFACVDTMRPIAERHGVSVARVALAWLLSRPAVSSVIVGAKSIEQLQDNLQAGALELAPEDLAALESASALPPEYPGWMLQRQARNRDTSPKR